jgi:transcriptional regulator with XRE-family HTH domain
MSTSALSLNRGASTSTGAVPRRPSHLIVGVLLVGLGTSLEPLATDFPQTQLLRQNSQTTNGLLVEQPNQQQTTQRCLASLRMMTGLTWEQLASVFGVSRQAVHVWMSGAPLHSTNEAHLRALFHVITKIDRGTARANRTLLESSIEGQSVLEMLTAKEYDRILELVGIENPRLFRPSLPISAEARALKMPPKPEYLVDALQDRIPQELKTSRTPRQSVRVKRSAKLT